MERNNVKQGALQTVEASRPRRAPAGLFAFSRRALSAAVLIALAPAAVAQTTPAPIQTIASGSVRVPLLELFTSEGCSSCPPAEAWLSKLASGDGPWQRVVPVAFHVDYWDYLGWADVFARPEFSERQRDYASAWKSDRVYTPGFAADGREWRGWLDGRELPAPRGEIGSLSLDVFPGSAAIRFTLAQSARRSLSGHPVAHVAVLGMGLSRQVKAGENKGKRLVHDFVVMGFQRVPLQPTNEAWTGRVTWSVDPVETPARYAAAAWVTSEGSHEPLQAVGGWLTADAVSALRETPERKDGMSKINKTEKEWREILSPEEYRVTREKGTEMAFTGSYWNTKDDGVYVCVACGQPLFSSDTKFDSGTGWPSFYEPVDGDNVDTEHDRSLGMQRTEVLCSRCESHLGHVFEDGPRPTGLRYCINSVSLKFVPKDAKGEKSKK